MSFSFRNDFTQYLRRATPSLPDDMRALIDEAVAAGRVTVVPQGASGAPWAKWDGQRLVDDTPGSINTNHFFRARQAMLDRTSAKAAVRRAEISADVRAGFSFRAIAENRGEGVESTRKIVQAIQRQLASSGAGTGEQSRVTLVT